MKEGIIRYRTQIVSILRTLTAYLLLPNLLFAIAGSQFELLPRALVNVDYLAVALIAPFVWTGVAVSLMSAALLMDLFRCSGPIYYFTQLDAVEALTFIRHLPMVWVIVEALAVLLAASIISWIFVKLGGRGVEVRSRSMWVGILALMFGTLGVWGGNSSLRFRDDAATPNLCTSAVISMGKTIIGGIVRKDEYIPPTSIDSATRRAGWFDSTPSHNLVLVILESGGLPTDPQWREWMEAPFAAQEVRARYDVRTGTVPFHGATVPGELRELCAIQSSATSIPPRERLENCLSLRMRSAGLRTLYFHGFSPEFFHRSAWLPTIGFEEQYFHPQLHKSGLRDCGGPFRGTCDEDVINHVGDYLAKDPHQKYFTEILTLNSHLPVSPDQVSSAILRCGEANAMIQDEAACNLFGLVIRAERAVAKVAVRPDLPETEFLIVGDHAPPFMRRSRRDNFSKESVPYFHLVPRRLDKNSSRKQ